ncbi:MAG TPA: hypothetical protein VHD76_07655 [Bryobacteraceae bacterium]|nr:hypothetical protein [Bryobacteraceae bacterium]
MRAVAAVFLVSTAVSCLAGTDTSAQRAWELERKGNSAGALQLLREDAESSGATAQSRLALVDFLQRHRDPGARAACERALQQSSGEDRRAILRRLVIMDTLAGDQGALVRDLTAYHDAGGTDLSLPAAPSGPTRLADGVAVIPGPIRSFSRMAALSPDLGPEGILPALARNIVTNGYQATSSNEALEQTEYLKLVIRYLSQARELDALAGAKKAIVIETCDSAQTGDLLRVLGYRIRGACGSDLALETVNASRAFLTIDSGFPLADLEQSLRTNQPFHYAYAPTELPVLYGTGYWASASDKQSAAGFIDYFVSDPSLCRLYLGLAKLDPETAREMRRAIPLARLRAYAHVLDFFGGMFEIRDGKAVVPGGPACEKAWADLVGASPDNPTAFFDKLLAKDDGWLASYFDALARLNGPGEAYLATPERLKRFYSAIHGRVTSPGPARPVFRANTEMLLLTSRIWITPDGQLFVPGSLDVWRQLFIHHPRGKYDNKLSKAASSWKSPDDVLDALFGLCRKAVENEPLKIFLAITDIERRRTNHLDAETVDLLARSYHDLGSQYSIFSEAPEITGKTIALYIDVAQNMQDLRDHLVRADAGGSLQGLVGLWQIFCRQGFIPQSKVDESLAGILGHFAQIKSEQDVFDGGRAGVKILLAATGTPDGVSPEDRIVDLLAGGPGSSDSEVQTTLVENLVRILEAQKLISLTTLFDLSDNLESISKGEKVNNALVAKAASRIADLQLPRAGLSSLEKSTLSFGYWSERHIDAQRKLNLRALLDKASRDPKKLDDIREALAPFLRDTLVGLNYAYYAPPGAQLLLTNPLFVRSHDFVGLLGSSALWHHTEVQGNGWPSSAGGKLTGSLADLPYALAEAEQNFLVPSREQALIWGDLVPQMLLSATVPRWWRVTPAQLHWVTLHMGLAETLYAEAALNKTTRTAVLSALSEHAPPIRVSEIRAELDAGRARQALEQTTPSEMFHVAQEIASQGGAAAEPIAAEIRREAAEAPGELNYRAISRAFGTPKPTLANSFEPQLLDVRTFPALMGYSSRILAESWESSLLYYAALADDLHVPPAQLNLLVPLWTRETVEHIFATHLEDWPALLRSLRLVGDAALQQNHNSIASAAGGR